MERTVDEIQRTLAEFRNDLSEQNQALELKLEQFVLRAVYESHNSLLDLRLTNMESRFDSKIAAQDSRLKLVEKAVFGTIGLICTAVVIAVIALVINKNGMPSGAP